MKIGLFVFLIVCSCNLNNLSKESAELNNKSQSLSDSVILIFKKHNKPENNIKIKENVFFQLDDPLIRLWDDFHSQYITPNGTIIDTLVFNPKTDNILFQHKVDYFDEVNILLKKGDTVEVDYYGFKPIFNIKNRTLPKYEMHIDSLINSRLSKNNGYTNFTLYKYPILSAGESFMSSNIFDLKPNNGKKAISDLEFSRNILDSLYSINDISEGLYHLMRDKLSYLPLAIKVNLGLLSKSEAIKVFDSMNSEIKLPYSFALNYSEEYVNKFIHPKYKMVKRQSSVDLDYVSIYEDIEESNYFPSRIKELLLYKYLVLIGKNLSIATFKSICSRFQNNASDSFLINNINTAFFLDFDRLRLVSDSVFLIDSYKGVTTLKSILEKNQNKVVYIDFWASWCLPCINLLPSSKKLSETYRNEDFAVIYLSIDKNYEDWRKSADRNNLLYQKNSFLIVNPSTATYLKKLKLNEIPRYLLFDKKGNLIYDKAPHPDDEELKTLIKSLF